MTVVQQRNSTFVLSLHNLIAKMKCKVLNCGRSDVTDPGLHFYRFPKDPTVRRELIKVCVGDANEEDILFFKLTAQSRMCSVSINEIKKYNMLQFVC